MHTGTGGTRKGVQTRKEIKRFRKTQSAIPGFASTTKQEEEEEEHRQRCIEVQDTSEEVCLSEQIDLLRQKFLRTAQKTTSTAKVIF